MAGLYVKVADFVGTVYHNPVDNVVVTRAATAVTNNDWVRALLKSGHLVECEAPAVAAEQFDVEPAAAAPAAEDNGATLTFVHDE